LWKLRKVSLYLGENGNLYSEHRRFFSTIGQTSKAEEAFAKLSQEIKLLFNAIVLNQAQFKEPWIL
jgi:hypothetical protein